MHFLSLELKGYLPLSHCGTDYFKADFVKTCTALLGNNGSGKSSILRVLTPYPETRTDYAKNGLCKKIISHNDHIYELTSDFSNATKAHSFKKDDVELNPSGATEIQTELCDEHFGYSPLLERLLGGKFKLCDMRRAERKELFMSTYPSDLSFISGDHRKVKAQLNVYNNNLKMLKEREFIIQSKLLDQAQRLELWEFKDDLIRVTETIDRFVTVMEHDKANHVQNEEYNKLMLEWNQPEQQCAAILDHIQNITDRIREVRRNYPELGHVVEFTHSIVTLNNSICNTTDKIENTKQQMSILRDRIEEFDKYADLDIETELNGLIGKKASILADIERLPKEEFLQLLPSTIDGMERDYPVLQGYVTSIHGLTGELWTPQQVEREMYHLRDQERELSQMEATSSRLAEDLSKIQHRMDSDKSYSYPEECTLPCKLKQAVSKRREETQKEYDRIASIKEKNDKEIEKLKTTITSLKNALVCPSTALPFITGIMEYLSSYSLVKNVLVDTSLISVLKDDPYEITNKVLRIIDLNKAHYIRQEYMKELHITETKISTLNTTLSVANKVKMISASIYADRVSLEMYVESVNSLTRELLTVTKQLTGVTQLDELAKELNQTVQQYQQCSTAWWVRSRIQFDNDIISKYQNIKHEVTLKLGEIQTTLREQDNLIVRLEEEVMPNITTILKERAIWSIVETGLSPNTGVPHVYLVRYVNKLIEKVNSYIKSVWYYDMELVYLNEEKPIDFDIQVMINKSSIVKDLNILSDGQKAMVSLAFTLAICLERNYTTNYPLNMDEVDPALTDNHRIRLTGLISDWIDTKKIRQLFLVNHFVVHTGISECDAICLSTEGIVTPPVYNEHATIN